MKGTKKVVSAFAAVCAACALCSADASADFDSYPVGLGLLPVSCLEVPGPDSGVWLFRLNLLAGCNRATSGLDLGAVGNWTKGDAYSLALAAGYNVSDGNGGGIQLAAVNFVEKEFGGVQVGLANMTWGIGGLQLGAVNATSEGRGLQIGVVNLAESFSGLQLGLMNMNQESALVMMPILNAWF